MKVTLNEDYEIRGALKESGSEVVVNKELGERLVDEGIANRIIEATENRVIGKQVFSDHRVFGR